MKTREGEPHNVEVKDEKFDEFKKFLEDKTREMDGLEDADDTLPLLQLNWEVSKRLSAYIEEIKPAAQAIDEQLPSEHPDYTEPLQKLGNFFQASEEVGVLRARIEAKIQQIDPSTVH